jgi:hypothetical protein
VTTKRHRGPKGASWAAQAFERKIAKDGGVIRRSIRAAKKAGGLVDLITMAWDKGFTVYIGGGQIVIFCNPHPVTLMTPGMSLSGI